MRRKKTLKFHRDDRWTPNSPLRRAAAAALAYWESTNQALNRIEVHGHYLARGATNQSIDCFADLGRRYWRSVDRYLGDGRTWFEVLPATARRPLHALHIMPTARDGGDGSGALLWAGAAE